MTSLQEMKLTKPGESNELVVRQFPWIKGGVCDYCGVIDPAYPGHQQYKLCQHYQGRDMKCVFCKETADHDDVIRMSQMKVIEDPYAPGHLATMCGSYECTKKFRAKYHLEG